MTAENTSHQEPDRMRLHIHHASRMLYNYTAITLFQRKQRLTRMRAMMNTERKILAKPVTSTQKEWKWTARMTNWMPNCTATGPQRIFIWVRIYCFLEVNNIYCPVVLKRIEVDIFFLPGNYPDSLNDARAATKWRPDYLKAIVRGMISFTLCKLRSFSFGGTHDFGENLWKHPFL